MFKDNAVKALDFNDLSSIMLNNHNYVIKRKYVCLMRYKDI